MAFKLGNERRGFKTPNNTPILRKPLEGSINAEANNDGTIVVDSSIPTNSTTFKKAVRHEMKHIEDMKNGRADYGDDWVRYKNKTYHRKNGKIKYNGGWHEEGSHKFPWEKRAVQAEKKQV